jgi:RHS repeat-associated protein
MTLPHANDLQAVRRYAETYEYDETGNFRRVSHTTLGLGGGVWIRRYRRAADSNRLSAVSVPADVDGQFSATYEHDDNGNVVRSPRLAGVTWDHANRITRVDLQGGGIAYYTYDAAGQRVRSVIATASGRVADERLYLGGYEIHRQYRGGGGVQLERETLHAAIGSQRVALVETAIIENGVEIAQPVSRQRYQLGNHQGTALLEINEAGLTISYEEYYPYGDTAYHSARANVEVSAKRYRYNGKERDAETGLYYYGARYYMPWLGRWMSCDPLGPVDGLNLYTYVSGNPVKHVDATGLSEDPKEKLVYEDTSKGTAIKTEDVTPRGAATYTKAERPRWDLEVGPYGRPPRGGTGSSSRFARPSLLFGSELAGTLALGGAFIQSLMDSFRGAYGFLGVQAKFDLSTSNEIGTPQQPPTNAPHSEGSGAIWEIEDLGLVGYNRDNGIWLGNLFAGGAAGFASSFKAKGYETPSVLLGVENIYYLREKRWATERLGLMEGSYTLAQRGRISLSVGSGGWVNQKEPSVFGLYLFGSADIKLRQEFSPGVTAGFGAEFEPRFKSLNDYWRMVLPH